MDKENRAYKYALWCVQDAGELVPRYVKRQAEKWLYIADGKSKTDYIDDVEVERICSLLKLMNHPDLGIPLYDGLEDYAWFFIIAVFCTKEKATERWKYKTAILEICRKNFKTFNSAVIFIIAMLTLPMFSRFFSVAPDYKLSSELRLALRKIIKCSPCLIPHFKINRDMIVCKATDAEYTPLAYSTDRMDGKLANVFLADEAGALDAYPVEAMRSSQITLKNKLGIIISTKYPNDNNVMIDEIDRAKKVLDDLYLRDDVFALLYEPNEEIEKEWQENDLCIYQSNPVAVSNEEVFNALSDLRADAVLYENKRENYLCKHNNISYKGLGVEGYVDVLKVRECKVPLNDEFWNGRRVFVGVDLSLSNDNTSVAMVTYEGEQIYGKTWGFIPKNKIEEKSKREKFDYKTAIEKGECFACGEDVVDYSFIEEFVFSLPEKYGVEIVQLGYDRYNAISSVQKWESGENPIECVEVKQYSSVLHMPTKLLLEKILEKQFTYEENLLLEVNFQNARCTEDTNLNKYVNKKKSAGKVDMVVALIVAIYLMQLEMLYDEENFGIQII